MALTATFFQFSKRLNSTKVPTGGTSYPIILKEGCSVQSPVIGLKWDGSSNPSQNNMAWIGPFHRYYWITDWTYQDRIWWASLKTDVLASLKPVITQTAKYVLRAASDYDPAVIDTKYPAKGEITTHYGTVTNQLPWVHQYATGMIVCGIIGQGNTYSPSGVGYVGMTPATFNSLITGCFNAAANTWGQGSLGTDIGTALDAFGDKLQKSIQNPFQFINSARWYPFTYSGAATTAKLGYLDTGVTVNALPSPTATHILSFSLNPQLNGTDVWQNIEPFTEYLLSFPPFGNFTLDSHLLQGAITLVCSCETDLTTGLATLRVTASTGTETRLMLTTGCKLGVDMEIAGNSVDYAGAVGNVFSGAAKAVTAALLPSPGSIAGAVSAVGSLAGSLAPEAHSSGAQGSLAGIFTEKGLYIFTKDPVDPDITEHGRPLMKVETLGNLSGYILCADGDLPALLTPAEMQEISGYLTGGFFNE